MLGNLTARCGRFDAQTAFSVAFATIPPAGPTPDQVHKPQRTVEAVAEDRAPAADLAQGRATADRSAQTVQVVGRVRAEAAGRATVADLVLDHALAQAFLERAFLEGLAEVVASGVRMRCRRVAVHDRTSL